MYTYIDINTYTHIDTHTTHTPPPFSPPPPPTPPHPPTPNPTPPTDTHTHTTPQYQNAGEAPTGPARGLVYRASEHLFTAAAALRKHGWRFRCVRTGNRHEWVDGLIDVHTYILHHSPPNDSPPTTPHGSLSLGVAGVDSERVQDLLVSSTSGAPRFYDHDALSAALTAGASGGRGGLSSVRACVGCMYVVCALPIDHTHHRQSIYPSSHPTPTPTQHQQTHQLEVRHPNEVASLLACALARRHRSSAASRPVTRSSSARASAAASHRVVSFQVKGVDG